jgi:hypothetical protein
VKIKRHQNVAIRKEVRESASAGTNLKENFNFKFPGNS